MMFDLVVNKYQIFLLFSLFFLVLSCGGSDATQDPQSDAVIVISDGGLLATTQIEVAPGDVVVIINNDSEAHTITSQSDENQFDDTGDFDVTVGSHSKGILIIPDTFSDGDVIYFYDKFFNVSLTPSSGTFIINEDL